jgi:hypothetical protein
VVDEQPLVEPENEEVPMGQPAHATSSGSRSRRYAVAFVLPTAIVALVAAATGAHVPASADAASTKILLDHYQCYRVDPSPFQPRSVVLRDQFGGSKAVVTQLQRLCSPVHKNGSLVRNPRAHLACYAIRTASFHVRQVTYTNQLGRGRLAVVKPVQLCVPSGKSLDLKVAPPPAKGLDHYQCYLVKPTTPFKSRKVALLDQFGKSAPLVVTPTSLCAPVSKNAGRVLDRQDHLVCYSLRTTTTFKVRRALIVNQFGKATMAVVTPEVLCVPSLKRLV